MTIQLVVVRPFGTYLKGNVIGDAASIAAISASEHASNVVRVQQHQPSPAVSGQQSSPAQPAQGS